MQSLKRAIQALRVWIWGDLDQDRLSPEHGWLLPAPATLHTMRQGAPRR